jgi:hypothetical protein
MELLVRFVWNNRVAPVLASKIKINEQQTKTEFLLSAQGNLVITWSTPAALVAAGLPRLIRFGGHEARYPLSALPRPHQLEVASDHCSTWGIANVSL